MNLLEAEQILELPKKYTNTDVKKNYRRLAMIYHPDKCTLPDANERFTKLNEAHVFILKNQDNFDFFKMFSFAKNSLFNNKITKKKMIITLTPKEYIKGCYKEIPVYSKCNCVENLCINCAGSGYNIPTQFKLENLKLDTCLECMGGGVIQNCGNCVLGNKKVSSKPLTIPKRIDLNLPINFENFEISFKLDEPYFYKNGKLYCYFDISLKESLTGFTKSFNDAFGHHVIKTEILIKSGDGYNLKHLTLIFRVIYPEQLSKEIVEQLKLINF